MYIILKTFIFSKQVTQYQVEILKIIRFAYNISFHKAC